MKPLNLIDKDALIALYGQPCHSFLDVIEDMPTIEAVPMDFHERCLDLEIQKRFAVERERNVLLAELQDTKKAVGMTNGLCDICKHQNAHESECEASDFLCYNCIADCACKECYPNESHYEWRGVKPENE